MRLKPASPSLQCPHLPFHSFASQNPTSLIASPSSTKHSKRVQILICKSFHFPSQPLNKPHAIERSCASSFNEVLDLADDEESKEEHGNINAICTESETKSFAKHRRDLYCESSFLQSKIEFLEPRMLGIWPEPPEWPEREAVIRAGIEMRANRVDLPLSIRMIKKKQWQWKEGSRDLGELSSLKKAFSSIVFIIVELQIYVLLMRQALCYEDLEVIIDKVQREIHSLFVWLFQQVFSQTPALMIHVMILSANFCVFSTAHNIGILDPSLLGPKYKTTTETVSIQHPSVVPYEISRVGYQELNSAVEVRLWNSTMDEAIKMQAGLKDVVLDRESIRWLVSPVTAELEQDDYMEYSRTDLLYQMILSQEPKNSLLLSNYAQFLHLVAHDHNRAEECFKRAIQVETPDAECLSQYANFLWVVRKDLWGAEERYLQALALEPNNPYHASKYADFLWNTGGEETCFPLNTTHKQQ